MAGTNQLAQPDLVGHVREHFPQPFTVTTIGCGGDAVDQGMWISGERCVDHLPVGRCGAVVRLIDDQQIQRRQLVKIAGQGLHHRKRGLTRPGFLTGIEHRGADARIYPRELALVLRGKFVTMGQHTGFGIGVGEKLARRARETDGLACTGRGDPQRIAVGLERPDTARDELALARSENHGRISLLRPGGPRRYGRGSCRRSVCRRRTAAESASGHRCATDGTHQG